MEDFEANLKEKINQSKEKINKLYSEIPEEFTYKKETADQKIEAEANSLFLKAKDKLQ
jgi:predicted RNA-binding protein with PIN domain